MRISERTFTGHQIRARTLLLLALATCLTLTAGLGQQNSAQRTGQAELLERLRSDSAQVRSDALEHLRADPVALSDHNVKAALINLLERENRVTLSDNDEGYGEYRDWLSETVAKLVDWNDPRQVCILANSQSLPDELADHAEVAVPCLLQRLKNAPASSRVDIAVMLVHISARNNGLDTTTTQMVRQVILGTLHDPDEGVRSRTVRALAEFGAEDIIPALKEVSKTDPAIDKLDHSLWIREYAVKAIAAIQTRAGSK